MLFWTLALVCRTKSYWDERLILFPWTGHGHTARYLDRNRVSCYVALEPNIIMHSELRATANEAGYHEADGSLVILSCGAEDTTSILSSLATGGKTQIPPVDAIVAVLTICSIPDPQRTLARLVRDVLKPDGVFFIYEHILSHRDDVAWWQRLWTPVWGIFFDGCRLDRPTDLYMKTVEIDCEDGTKESAWKEWKSWNKEGDDEENLFWHNVGRYVKK